jgi:putative ABC transport system substrate-binding protein
LLKEAFPSIRRVGLLAASAAATASAERGATALGIELVITGPQRAGDLAAAFVLPKPVDAWQVQDGATYFAQRRTIVELVARQRVPAIYPHGVYVEAGGLMSYAADLKEQFRRAAAYVDRILRGARPAELPVEQPMSFKLTINLKTARAIGLDMPRTLMLRADEVLQ